jgi:hypothetical protein
MSVVVRREEVYKEGSLGILQFVVDRSIASPLAASIHPSIVYPDQSINHPSLSLNSIQSPT